MPEGHTIHRLARDHGRWFTGQRVRVSSPQGRFGGEANALDGRRFEGAEAWGKHLFHRYEGGAVVHVHLGLIGRFRRHTGDPPPPRGAIRYRLTGDERTVDLIGPMRCALGDDRLRREVVHRLGPDPLRDDADPEVVWERLQRTRRGIGATLMDQSVVAGIGNVYRAELLFLVGLHPEVPAREVPRDVFDDLWARTVHLLDVGVRLNRIVTRDPREVGVPASRLRRADARYVYKRRVCRRCGDPIRWWEAAGRRVYACETCQPPGGPR